MYLGEALGNHFLLVCGWRAHAAARAEALTHPLDTCTQLRQIAVNARSQSLLLRVVIVHQRVLLVAKEIRIYFLSERCIAVDSCFESRLYSLCFPVTLYPSRIIHIYFD
jgi:hypothetical protein